MHVTGVNEEELLKLAEELQMDFIFKRNESINLLGRECDSRNRFSPIHYANRSDFTRYNVYKDGQVLCTGINRLALSEVKIANNDKVVIETVFNEAEFNEQRALYQEYQTKILKIFVWGLYFLSGGDGQPQSRQGVPVGL